MEDKNFPEYYRGNSSLSNRYMSSSQYGNTPNLELSRSRPMSRLTEIGYTPDYLRELESHHEQDRLRSNQTQIPTIFP